MSIKKRLVQSPATFLSDARTVFLPPGHGSIIMPINFFHSIFLEEMYWNVLDIFVVSFNLVEVITESLLPCREWGPVVRWDLDKF